MTLDPKSSELTMPAATDAAGVPGPLADSADAGSFCYPGGKGGDGVYQTLINMIPPHDIYIETHLGGGAIMRHKKLANINIGIDSDPEALRMWDNYPGIITIKGDATRLLKSWTKGPFPLLRGNAFVYLDPPYLPETLKYEQRYNHKMSREQHIELLKILCWLPCKVMISGYWSQLYDDWLHGWNKKSFQASTRGGLATDWIWFNYPWPTELHDYRYLGDTFRERERIKRKRLRWMNRLKKMPILEKRAMLEALNEV